jgi:hypothetical protein
MPSPPTNKEFRKKNAPPAKRYTGMDKKNI